MSDDRVWLTELLPKTAHKHIGSILEHFVLDTVSEVEIVDARVPVEGVDAYGLTLQIDALGNAVTVGFPYGAEVTA